MNLRYIKVLGVIVSGIMILFSCASNGKIGSKRNNTGAIQEKYINAEGILLSKYNLAELEILKRYLLVNNRWDYRNARGSVYAVRREINNMAAEYLTDSSEIITGTIIISFGKVVGIRERENITYSDKDESKIKLKIFQQESGNESFQASYLILNSTNLNIEVSEKVKTRHREYTQQALNEVKEELRAVFENAETIKQKGFYLNSKYYPLKFDSSFFRLEDSDELGVYKIKGAFNIKEEGDVYLKVLELKSRNVLSGSRLSTSTKRKAGWSPDVHNYFYYETEVRVFEGAFSDPYSAVFELWFRPVNGKEIKLAELEREIVGWNRRDTKR